MELADGTVTWTFHVRHTGVELEARNRGKLESLRSASLLGLFHDIKTPLTGIVGGCELLASTLEDLTPDQLEIMKIVHSSAERLHDLVLDILEVSTLEAVDVAIGEMRSSQGGRGMALLRIETAENADAELIAGDARIRVIQ